MYTLFDRIKIGTAETVHLRARLELEQQLVDDAESRGWAREVERHQATRKRIEALLAQLGS